MGLCGEGNLDVSPTLLRLETLVLVAAVAATGWPTAQVGLPLDGGGLVLAAVALGALHHLRLGLPPAAGAPRTVRAGVALVLAFALAGLALASSRGTVLAGDRLAALWLLAALHWACLSSLEHRAPAEAEPAAGRAAFVPLLLLPWVVLDLAGHAPATAGQASVALLAGAAAWLAPPLLPPPPTAAPWFRVAAALAPLLLPLAAALPQLLDLGLEARAPGDVVVDAGHGSTAGVDVGVLPLDARSDQPPGHARLAALATAHGFKVRAHDGPLTEQSLEGAAVLALLMNSRPYAPAERAALEGFVRRGGGLLVVGDHTDVETTSSAMNPLLEPFGVQLRFDTVWRRLDAALGDVAVLPTALTLGLRRLYFSTGCSLELAGRQLQPFVVTSGCLFSDRGDYKANAFLGDGRRGPGEAVGSLPLAALGSHGRGRVVVLGDSAFLQNGVLHLNRAFALRVLDWLSRGERTTWARGAAAAWAWLALGLLWLAVAARRAERAELAALLAGGVALALLFDARVARALVERTPVRPERLGPAVAFDLAHGTTASFFWNRGESGSDRDVQDLFVREVEARGMEPWLLEDADGPLDDEALAPARVLVVVHPRRPYAPGELAAVRRFVLRGGGLLLLTGPGRDGGRRDLLPALGLTASPWPVGREHPVLFADQFPLALPYGQAPFPPATVSRGTSVTTAPTVVPVDPVQVGRGAPVLTALGHTVAVARTLGRGRVLLVGDREHFADFAFVDGDGRVDRGRLRYLGEVLAWLGGAGGPR